VFWVAESKLLLAVEPVAEITGKGRAAAVERAFVPELEVGATADLPGGTGADLGESEFRT
jgi:hypothetical protein